LENSDENELVCDPEFANNVPCTCMYDYNIATTTSECLAYIVCLTIFLMANRKKKQKIDLKTGILIGLFVLAFSFHMSFVIYAYTGFNQCRKINSMTSYFAFAPQMIFFLIFIWVIFKLLVVWRVMES